MVTKNIKSVGNILGQSKDYWINAAKQFIWPIDFEHKHILVPEKDLELAADNLMITHFRSAGWHVQSVIEVNYTKQFIPHTPTTKFISPVKKEIEKESEFKFNQAFKIVSTGCELKIISIDKKTIILKYTNREKSDITTSPDNLKKNINLGVFVKI